MHRDEEQAESDYGQLMACLMSERDRFATESDFQAFALESIRRFIVDLRSLDIELMMRPKYLNGPPFHFRERE
jgi:predicted exporter